MLKYAVRNRLTSELVARPIDTVLYFPGYPGYGSTIKDYSGRSNDGTITQAIWTRLSSGLWTLDFDGLDDKVVVTKHASINNLNERTYLLWLNPDEQDGNGILNKNTASVYWWLEPLAAQVTALVIHDGAANARQSSTASIPPVNTWTLCGMTYSVAGGNVIKLYNNGVELTYSTTVAGVGNPIDDSATNLTWGDVPTAPFDGTLALMRVYNAVLTAAQQLAIYQQERHLFNV